MLGPRDHQHVDQDQPARRRRCRIGQGQQQCRTHDERRERKRQQRELRGAIEHREFEHTGTEGCDQPGDQRHQGKSTGIGRGRAQADHDRDLRQGDGRRRPAAQHEDSRRHRQPECRANARLDGKAMAAVERRPPGLRRARAGRQGGKRLTGFTIAPQHLARGPVAKGGAAGRRRRRQDVCCVHFGHQRHRRAARCGTPVPAAARLGRKARHLGAQRGDRLATARRSTSDRRGCAARDRARKLAHPAVQVGELACETDVPVGRQPAGR